MLKQKPWNMEVPSAGARCALSSRPRGAGCSMSPRALVVAALAAAALLTFWIALLYVILRAG